MKIVKVMTIVSDVLFEGLLQNCRYVDVRENNMVLEFIIADFSSEEFKWSCHYIRDFEQRWCIESGRGNINTFVIGFGHIETFLDSYYEYLVIKNIDFALAINKPSKVPQSLLKGRMNIDKLEDGEIIYNPFGIVFRRKNKKGKLAKFLFQVNNI